MYTVCAPTLHCIAFYSCEKWPFSALQWRKIMMIHKCQKSQCTAHYRVNYWVYLCSGWVNQGGISYTAHANARLGSCSLSILCPGAHANGFTGPSPRLYIKHKAHSSTLIFRHLFRQRCLHRCFAVRQIKSAVSHLTNVADTVSFADSVNCFKCKLKESNISSLLRINNYTLWVKWWMHKHI